MKLRKLPDCPKGVRTAKHPTTTTAPVFFPVRLLAVIYTDFFRGVPTILVIALLGFGAPALAIEGIPTSTTFWGITSLVLIYTAYVSEVYRAGIEAVPHGRTARRLEWAHLPPQVRALVEGRLGSPVLRAGTQGSGFTPGFATRLTAEDGSRLLVREANLKARMPIQRGTP